MNNLIRVLNFDNSLFNQKRLLAFYEPEIIDLFDLGPKARLWMNRHVKDAIEARIQKNSISKINLFGSGDFHHITNILLNQIKDDFSLIVFDFHPDWDILPPRYGCGSWITEALRNKRLKKCILLGIASEDISNWNIQAGNLSSLKNNRLEIYPYQHAPTNVYLRRVPENVSLEKQKGSFCSKVIWKELRTKVLADFILALVKQIPTKKVYISIDKDCLRKEYAITNWEEGLLSLEQLLQALKIIKDNSEIIGLDITGEYSPISVSGKFKGILSRLDHPKKNFADSLNIAAISEINERTNLKILDLVTA